MILRSIKLVGNLSEERLPGAVQRERSYITSAIRVGRRSGCLNPMPSFLISASQLARGFAADLARAIARTGSSVCIMRRPSGANALKNVPC